MKTLKIFIAIMAIAVNTGNLSAQDTKTGKNIVSFGYVPAPNYARSYQLKYDRYILPHFGVNVNTRMSQEQTHHKLNELYIGLTAKYYIVDQAKKLTPFIGLGSSIGKRNHYNANGEKLSNNEEHYTLYTASVGLQYSPIKWLSFSIDYNPSRQWVKYAGHKDQRFYQWLSVSIGIKF